MKKGFFIYTQIILFFIVTSLYAEEDKRAMKLTSPNFKNQGEIPKLYTCDGKDISPALSWSDVPEGTKSFALIVDDPDAPDPECLRRADGGVCPSARRVHHRPTARPGR